MKSKIWMQSLWLSFGICISMLLTNCSPNQLVVEEIESFPVTKPVVTDTGYVTEYVAEILSVQNVELRAKVDGYLENIHVDEGERVNQGQLLFSINGQAFRQGLTKAQAALASARADLKAAEVELKSATALVEKNIISQTELELAQARYEALQAKIAEAEALEANAQLELQYTQIRAPFSGIINRIPNKVGSLVEAGTLLTTISNNQEVFAYFNLSERDYLDYITTTTDIKPKRVGLQLANGSTYPHKGEIETIESEFDQSTGNIAFRARFPNPDQILKHGGSGKVQLRTQLKEATLIPQKSTFEVQGNTYVFVVNDESKVEMRRVTPSMNLPQVYVISSGLQPDEQFIYEGIQQLKEGDRIESRPVNASLVQVGN